MMQKRLSLIQDLKRNWNWSRFADDRLFRRLMVTENGWYRRDMKISLRVGSGKKMVKFKFVYDPNYADHKVIIEAGDPDLRLTWRTTRDETKADFIVYGKGIETKIVEVWEMEELLSEGNDDFIKFMRVINPEIEKAIPLLDRMEQGLNNFDRALHTRFVPW